MKKTLLTTFLFALLAVSSSAQYRVETDPKTGKKGLIYSHTGTVTLPFEYDNILPLAEQGLITGVKDKKMGAVDLKGRTLIPFKYALLDFTLGQIGRKVAYAAVSEVYPAENQWGLVDLRGELILPLQFAYVQAVLPDLLVARAYQDSLLQFFDGKGKPLFTRLGMEARRGFDDQSITIITADRRSYFLQKTGEPFFDGRYADLKWTDGQLVICGKPGKQGLLQHLGDTILPFNYREISADGNHTFLVEQSGKMFGVVNAQGQFIIPSGKQKIQKWRFGADAVWLVRPDGGRRTHLYRNDGQLVAVDCYVQQANFALRFPPDDASFDPWRYLNVSRQDNSTGLFHADGRPILPIQFAYINYCSDRHPLLASTKSEQGFTQSRWMAFNWDGQQVLPGQYRQLAFTYNPQLFYGIHDSTLLWGFIHLDRPENTRYEYERLDMLPSGYFISLLKGQWFLFDPETKPVKIEKFDRLFPPNRSDYEQFRQQKMSGTLIATGTKPGQTERFAINEKGKSFQFLPPVKPQSGVGQAPSVATAIPYPDTKVEEMVIEAPAPPEVERVFERIESMPEFPGGEEALMQFIKQNLRYPDAAREINLSGKVILRFVVEKDGSLSGITIIKDIGAGCGKEAINMVRKMPKWKPGMQGGKAVRVYFTLPVEFILEK